MNNAYVTTITIATVPFGYEESEDRIYNLSSVYMQTVASFFEERGLLDKLELEGYWKNGCCIVRILVFLKVLPPSYLDESPVDKQFRHTNSLISEMEERIKASKQELYEELKIVSAAAHPNRPATALSVVEVSTEEVTSNDSGKLGKLIK